MHESQGVLPTNKSTLIKGIQQFLFYLVVLSYISYSVIEAYITNLSEPAT